MIGSLLSRRSGAVDEWKVHPIRATYRLRERLRAKASAYGAKTMAETIRLSSDTTETNGAAAPEAVDRPRAVAIPRTDPGRYGRWHDAHCAEHSSA